MPSGRAHIEAAFDIDSMARNYAQWIVQRAVRLGELQAPERPAGTVDLAEYDQYEVLKRAAQIMPVFEWENPDNIKGLVDLTIKFEGESMLTDLYKVELERARRVKKARPDMANVPGTPEYDKEQRRLMRK